MIIMIIRFTLISFSCSEAPLTSSTLFMSQRSIGLPDVHSGYGFAIGNMAAFDMSDPTAVVSPGMLGKSQEFSGRRKQMNHSD